MIIYGSRNKELAKENLIDKCPNCGTQNCVDIYVFQKYAHVFWIPLFPIGKTGVSQCAQCKQVFKLKEMPSFMRNVYENAKAQTKTPVWTFSGMALIALLITAGFITEKRNNEKNARFILEPRVGDIFEIKTNTDQYTVYKVGEVSEDSVFVQMNNYETNKATGLDDLKKKEYSDELFGFSKTELKEMLQNGEIMYIDRK